MQMRKAMDVKGNMKIEFGDGKKEKVDPKFYHDGYCTW